MKILSFDPSGNFEEGYGVTGICIMEDGKPKHLWEIKAAEFKNVYEYWNKHVEIMLSENPQAIVMEGYRLYNHRGAKASTQANSTLETPQLIGLIRFVCWKMGIPCHIQYAYEVKSRWKESVLVNTNVLEQKGNRYYFDGKVTNDHKRDALKHALHFWRYKK